MTKPQLVFIPGAWHVPAHLEPLASALSALGYICHNKQMPAIGSSNPPKDLSDDIAFVRAMVEEAIGAEGNDVIVFCHSWGGVVAGSALSGMGKQAREQEGKKGGVLRVGYMCSFILPVGMSLGDALGEQWPEWLDQQDPYIYARDPNIFYNDLSPSEQKHWYSLTKPHAYGTFHAKTPAASWKEIPTSYLVCEDDLAIPEPAQMGMIEKVREAGGEIEVTKLKSGHSPFLSHVQETVGWVEGVTGQAREG